MIEKYDFLGRLNRYSEFSMVPLRICLGLMFFANGYGKVSGIAGVVGFFGGLGLPTWVAYFVAYSELVGGAFLVLGAFTKYISLVLSIIMVGAIVTAHKAALLSLDIKGFALALVALGGLLTLILSKENRCALDYLFCRKKQDK